MDISFGTARVACGLIAATIASACIGAAKSHEDGGAGAGADAGVPWPTHGWTHGAPGGAGLDERTLAALDADLAAGRYGLVDSFQVFRCGREVFSRKYAHDYAHIYATEAGTRGPLNARLTGRYNYFDTAWHPYYRGTDLHSMQSVSKTVTSLIFGIAMTRGDFKADLGKPVLSYFDAARVDHVDDRKRRMTLEDVLTMTTGLEWTEDVPYDDPRSDSSRMEATDDWVRYVIDKPMSQAPGTVFNYSSGATELLAYIFHAETGQDIEAYGKKFLFGPLGIEHYWKRTYLGVVDTEGGLYLTGAGLAKIGYLYLHGGMWDGERIVAERWVRESVTPHVDTAWPNLRYGFQWWLESLEDGAQPVWMGIGLGGQRLMVFPKQRLIATVTGWDLHADAAIGAPLPARIAAAITGAGCLQAAQ